MKHAPWLILTILVAILIHPFVAIIPIIGWVATADKLRNTRK